MRKPEVKQRPTECRALKDATGRDYPAVSDIDNSRKRPGHSGPSLAHQRRSSAPDRRRHVVGRRRRTRGLFSLSLPGSTLGGARRVRAERRRVRHVIGFIIFLIVIGFVAGFLARLLVPGPDPMSVLQTWLLGVVGSFIGGFIGYLLFRNDDEDGWVQPAGFIGSVIGAVIALLAYRAMQRRRITR